MDISQIILIAVISIITIILVFLGLQLFLVLRDVRQTIKRANRIVDEVGFSTTIEVLRLAFGNRKGIHAAKKVNRKNKTEGKRIVDITVPTGDGHHNGEKTTTPPLQIHLKAPRLFKGIPKRR